jgi:CRP-like cAMP-binding protein
MSDQLLHHLQPLIKSRRRLSAAETLFHLGDRVRNVYVVTSGELRLNRPLPHGALLTMQRARPDEVLAEASLFHARYHCDAVAVVPSEVAMIPKETFLDNLNANPSFAAAFCGHLAREVQRTRGRAEILSLKTVSERLDGWLEFNGKSLPLKGQGRRIASEINVSPEALYREIARRVKATSAQPDV